MSGQRRRPHRDGGGVGRRRRRRLDCDTIARGVIVIGLALYFFLAFTGGDLVAVWLRSFGQPPDHLDLQWVPLTGTVVTIEGAFATVATCAAAIVRLRMGRLTGLAAGAIGIVSSFALFCLVTGSWSFAGDSRTFLPAFASKFLGPVVLSFLPLLRTRILGGRRAGEPISVAGCQASALLGGESAGGAIGRRPARLRGWGPFDARGPDRSDDAVARLPRAPRPLPGAVARACALRGRSGRAWWWMASGLLALAAVRPLWTTYPRQSIPVQWLELGLLLLALGLLRAGAARLFDVLRVTRLLRLGDLRMATPEPPLLPGQSTVIATLRTREGGLVIETPRPRVAGPGQALLVGRDRRGRINVGAWDLLPYVPRIAMDGSFDAPAAAGARRSLLAPFAVLIAGAVLAWTLAR